MRKRAPIAAIAAMCLMAALVPSMAQAATPKCFGKKATIVSNKAVINGTKKDDVIVSRSTSGFNQISGKGGDDLICGGPSFDFILGGGGNDKMRGNGDLDFLSGDGGNDHLYGDRNDGGNADDVWYQFAKRGVNVNLSTGRATGEGTDTLHNIDGLFGSNFNDTLVGNDGTNFIWGNAGDDNIDGGTGLDLITPGDGDDTVDGGSEDVESNDLDIYYVNDATGPAQVDLQAGTASGQGLGTDEFTDFENVVGGDFDDTLDGDAGSNMLFGGRGNDALNGRGGFDYASYWFSEGPVNANLETNSSTATPVPGTDDQGNAVDLSEGNDTFQGLEGLLGSIGYDDTLVGDNQANYLDGDGGSDDVNAGGGDDWIVGGLGQNESVDGGAGNNDFWDYYGGDALNVNLLTGRITSPSLGTLTLTGVESVAGADQADTFTGDAAANTFYGWGGNDTFVGGLGDDKIDGGAGTGDSADPGDGNDTCAFVELMTGTCETLDPDGIDAHQLESEADAVATMRRNF